MINPFLKLVDMTLEVYSLFIIIYIILRLLVYFQVVNPFQPFVAKLLQMLADVVEPALSYIRRYIKPLNNIDLSPLILILLINFIQYSIYYYSVG